MDMLDVMTAAADAKKKYGTAATDARYNKKGDKGLIGYAVLSNATLLTLTAPVSSTLADMHATLSVSFTVPASGIVEVELTAYASAGASSAYLFGLKEGSTEISKDAVLSATSGRLRVTYRTIITGLTPGAVKTWTAAHGTSGANAGTINYGTTSGQVVMKVSAVPLA